MAAHASSAAPSTSATASSNGAASGPRTADIRNILVAGHTGAGKTALIERFLLHTRTIAKMGGPGDYVADADPEARAHKHSIVPGYVFFTHAGKHVNCIDSPGSPDLLGHAVAHFPPVETLLVVVDAAKGIEVATRRLMRHAAELGLPRMLVVNKIDHQEPGKGLHDLGALLESLREAFGPEVLAINLPIKDNTDVIDVFDHATAEGGPEPAISTVAEAHRRIVEQVVEMDEALTGEYFEKGDNLDPAKVRRAFEAAMRAGHLVPVCFVSARTGAGVDDLLHIVADLCPTPEHETPPGLLAKDAEGKPTLYDPPIDPAAPAVAHVFRILHDPFMGKLALIRVEQGTVRAKSELLHNEDRKPVRIGHLFRLRGKDHVEVDRVVAGDIAAIAKCEEVRRDSVLHADPALHLDTPALALPRPLYGVAVELKNHADETKFTNAIHKLVEEDPCFAMERIAATGQTVLRGLGELHLRFILERLRNRYGIEVASKPMKVAYKETITAPADGHHRHKKQTGGAGQFGEVYLRVAPLPPDHPEGFEFENATVGGSIPRQFMPAIEKGVRQVLATGAFAGYPLTGVRVEVYDGKHHDVDSKEVAFVAAGKRAFIDAVLKARPSLLEPFVTVEVTAPARHMGDITAHLSGKRGRIESSDSAGDACTVRAVAPLAELMNYASELKSMTGGQGAYTLEYSHDERTPPTVQQAVMAAYKPRNEED